MRSAEALISMSIYRDTVFVFGCDGYILYLVLALAVDGHVCYGDIKTKDPHQSVSIQVFSWLFRVLSSEQLVI